MVHSSKRQLQSYCISLDCQNSFITMAILNPDPYSLTARPPKWLRPYCDCQVPWGWPCAGCFGVGGPGVAGSWCVGGGTWEGPADCPAPPLPVLLLLLLLLLLFPLVCSIPSALWITGNIRSEKNKQKKQK